MKARIIIAVVIALFSKAAFARKASYERDTIYCDGLPYAIMHKTGGITHQFSIRNLRNEELILVHFVNRVENGTQTGTYIISFLSDGREGEMGNDMFLAKKLAKEVVANDLIRNGAINPEGERRFLMLYPKQLPPPTNTVVFGNGHPTGNTNAVENRNRAARVSIVGKQITQDGKYIGAYREVSRAAEGTIYTTQTFTNAANMIVAEATYYGVNTAACKLSTRKDGVTRIITLKSTFGPEQAVEVAAWLSAQYYF